MFNVNLMFREALLSSRSGPAAWDYPGLARIIHPRPVIRFNHSTEILGTRVLVYSTSKVVTRDDQQSSQSSTFFWRSFLFFSLLNLENYFWIFSTKFIHFRWTQFRTSALPPRTTVHRGQRDRWVERDQRVNEDPGATRATGASLVKSEWGDRWVQWVHRACADPRGVSLKHWTSTLKTERLNRWNQPLKIPSRELDFSGLVDSSIEVYLPKTLKWILKILKDFNYHYQVFPKSWWHINYMYH